MYSEAWQSKEQEEGQETSISVKKSDADFELPEEETRLHTPRFSKVISFLVQEIGINENALEEESELTIKSDLAVFLELPWEIISDKNYFVIREVVSVRKKPVDSQDNNLLILLSHAVEYKTQGSEVKLPSLKKDLDEEIKNIYSLLPELKSQENPGHFKLRSVYLSLHTTKDLLNITQRGKFVGNSYQTTLNFWTHIFVLYSSRFPPKISILLF